VAVKDSIKFQQHVVSEKAWIRLGIIEFNKHDLCEICQRMNVDDLLSKEGFQRPITISKYEDTCQICQILIDPLRKMLVSPPLRELNISLYLDLQNSGNYFSSNYSTYDDIPIAQLRLKFLTPGYGYYRTDRGVPRIRCSPSKVSDQSNCKLLG
jgi:hypothetical protein